MTSFEAGEFLDANTRTSAMDEVASLGVRSIRIIMYWREVAPMAGSRTKPDFDTTNPAAYAWGKYEEAIAAARARNWDILLTISGPVPRWATKGRTDQLTRPDPSEFAQFTTAVARQFGPRVQAFSIWNEPNLPAFLKPQYGPGKKPLSPAIYRGLYKGALKGLASGGAAKVPVYFGETAPRGTGKVVAPLTFLRGALCLDGRDRLKRGCGGLEMDGVAHHAYTTKAGPRFVPPSKNDVTIGVLRRLTSFLDRAGKVGALPSRVPLHLTEFGIQSTPDPFSGVSLQRQAEYRSLSERIAYDNPRVASFSQYLLRDDRPRRGPAISRYSGFESGLRTAGGKAKPSLNGFRLPLSATRRGSKVSLWGLVRPAGAATTAIIQRRSKTGAWRNMTSVSTNARGYFRASTGFVSKRQYRLVWTAPDGAVLAGAATRPVA